MRQIKPIHSSITPISVLRCGLAAVVLWLGSAISTTAYCQAPGEIEIALVEENTDQRLPCRVQVRGPNGNAIKPRAIDTVQGWSLVDGKLFFRGRAGDYHYDIFHGPEFAPARGHFILDKKSEAVDIIELPRHADLKSEGWYGGDLLSFHPSDKTQKWLAAEGLFMAASMLDASIMKSPPREGSATSEKTTSDEESTNNDASSLAVSTTEANVTEVNVNSYTSYHDRRAGSGLTIHHWLPNEPVADNSPSSQLIIQAKKKAIEDSALPVHVEIQKLWARDLPIWLASGRIDSVQLLSDHLTIEGKAASEVKPLAMPDGNFKGGRAGGRIVEQIYFQMLEAGLRIPLTAGSGFAKTPSPLGYNRVYALIGNATNETWWQAIRAGNSFVTNGPLLRVNANGMPPGHLFQSNEAIELDVGVVLTVADPVEYLEVIVNGSSVYRAALDEYAKQGGKIPTIKIDQSGWMVVRVITGREFSYRMATTSPFYFEIAGKQRVQVSAVDYFQKWLQKTREEIAKLPPEVSKLHQPYLQSAEKFWEARRQQASN